MRDVTLRFLKLISGPKNDACVLKQAMCNGTCLSIKVATLLILHNFKP